MCAPGWRHGNSTFPITFRRARDVHAQPPRREDSHVEAALEGERKQVTVLFADLKGSMELLSCSPTVILKRFGSCSTPSSERMMEAVEAPAQAPAVLMSCPHTAESMLGSEGALMTEVQSLQRTSNKGAS